MATLTRTVLGPRDHGRLMSMEAFNACTDQEGYSSEIIDGRICVSPTPELPHECLQHWAFVELHSYSRAHPAAINYISAKARVFIPSPPNATVPQPDIAAYQDFPYHLPIGEMSWRDISPILVVEIVSEDDPDKDLERNVELYQEVLSIREYWIVDPRPDPDRPTLRAYRRRGRRWQKPIDVHAGEIYETPRFLAGFSLLMDPRASH
jgi:Uma2 family endonuclease